MNTNKNFLRFMGFRKQTFTVGADQVHDSGDSAANTVTLTDAADGFGNIVNPGTTGTDLIVTVTADGAETGHRGTQYTLDAMTGAAFASPANVAAGEVTRIHSDDLTLHASNGTLVIDGVSSAVGYNLSLGETVEVYSFLGAGDPDTRVIPFHSVLTGTNAHALSQAQSENDMIIVPAANYLGADSISATATRLSFKSTAGTAVDDDILLIHGSGKFKAVCEMMQAALNAKHSHAPIVITDVANGIIPFSGQFDLGITACQITCA
jgi:hypothetical protein|tara:strand:+ start:312 stop:1106 length:795 start_codon:yes stop_codon:yes gene_type:complete